MAALQVLLERAVGFIAAVGFSGVAQCAITSRDKAMVSLLGSVRKTIATKAKHCVKSW